MQFLVKYFISGLKDENYKIELLQIDIRGGIYRYKRDA